MRMCLYRFVATVFVAGTCLSSLGLAADRPEKLQTAAVADPQPNTIEIREFEVRVDDRPAGVHRLTLKSDGKKQIASMQTDIKMDFIVYAYVFKSRTTETWLDGKVDLSDVRTEDGGKKRTFWLKTEGESQLFSVNGKTQNTPRSITMTTAYWRLPAAELRAKKFSIVDVDTGKFHEASFRLVGPETVTASGRTINCQHYKIDGPSPADLWFDDRDCLVRQRLTEQGHLAELRLKQIRIAKEETRQ